jgi:hypothetical protein
MSPDANPFGALSLIVAPAILTNACSILIMSTSNRVARTVDRARELSRELEASGDFTSPVGSRRLNELSASEERSLLLVRALRCGYVALSGFASATLLSLLGAVMVPAGRLSMTEVLEAHAIIAGATAVASLVLASTLLVRETRLAVTVLRAQAQELRDRASGRRHLPQ